MSEMLHTTVYGLGGFDPEAPNGNVIAVERDAGDGEHMEKFTLGDEGLEKAEVLELPDEFCYEVKGGLISKVIGLFKPPRGDEWTYATSEQPQVVDSLGEITNE